MTRTNAMKRAAHQWVTQQAIEKPLFNQTIKVFREISDSFFTAPGGLYAYSGIKHWLRIKNWRPWRVLIMPNFGT